jgi:hypothetical protein
MWFPPEQGVFVPRQVWKSTILNSKKKRSVPQAIINPSESIDEALMHAKNAAAGVEVGSQTVCHRGGRAKHGSFLLTTVV